MSDPSVHVIVWAPSVGHRGVSEVVQRVGRGGKLMRKNYVLDEFMCGGDRGCLMASLSHIV